MRENLSCKILKYFPLKSLPPQPNYFVSSAKSNWWLSSPGHRYFHWWVPLAHTSGEVRRGNRSGRREKSVVMQALESLAMPSSKTKAALQNPPVNPGWWLSGKESACNAGDTCRRHGFNPWVRKIPWRRTWKTSLVFLFEKSHGLRSLVGYSP